MPVRGTAEMLARRTRRGQCAVLVGVKSAVTRFASTGVCICSLQVRKSATEANQ